MNRILIVILMMVSSIQSYAEWEDCGEIYLYCERERDKYSSYEPIKFWYHIRDGKFVEVEWDEAYNQQTFGTPWQVTENDRRYWIAKCNATHIQFFQGESRLHKINRKNGRMEDFGRDLGPCSKSNKIDFEKNRNKYYEWKWGLEKRRKEYEEKPNLF